MPADLIDMKGQTIGRLTVERLVGVSPWGALWDCRCKCGVTTSAVGSALRSGRVKSCGCIRRRASPV
jgi:hypothetical protein